MNKLDTRIQAALQAATELPETIPEPTLAEEVLETFQGRRRWLMILSFIKLGFVAALLIFCVFQFFQQETTMAMIAYAMGATILAISYGCVFLFLWIQMNHNTTVREVKRLELQLALLTRELKDKES